MLRFRRSPKAGLLKVPIHHPVNVPRKNALSMASMAGMTWSLTVIWEGCMSGSKRPCAYPAAEALASPVKLIQSVLDFALAPLLWFRNFKLVAAAVVLVVAAGFIVTYRFVGEEDKRALQYAHTLFMGATGILPMILSLLMNTLTIMVGIYIAKIALSRPSVPALLRPYSGPIARIGGAAAVVGPMVAPAIAALRGGAGAGAAAAGSGGAPSSVAAAAEAIQLFPA
eukprot:tig00000681_g3080.t1